MAILRGKDLLLTLRMETGEFVPVGGLRTKTFSLSAGLVDITHADSGLWRTLLPSGGLRQANVAGSGVFIDDAAAIRARTLFFSGEAAEWQLVMPGSGTLTGPFQITNLDLSGDYRGEAGFSLSLSSAGEILFEAEDLT
ncbi:phage major tail protein, TP901-1 family [Parvularcula sp. LCG005]|uniref:phage major tail protein, TP901-1 family n=1 Tax=Parvularcula sp. LCG005 TaxID=3078805 RepID=UPI0029420FE7|nr:phage major tail protein, TP901-1 family [Parvularcula sp. LCG005]WOI53996.1 phage major tail protein, TP901-1 family [Parvularcula sp. LCG005]